MILGRAVNIWTGLIAAADAMLITVIGATQSAATAQEWAIILGAVGTFLGVLVAFLANQPPTLNVGDTVNVVTPAGQPNVTTTVATPPPAPPTGG